MKTDDLRELLRTVESVRSDRFPHLPAAFLRGVVEIEEANAESDERALSEIRKLVEDFISRQEEE